MPPSLLCFHKSSSLIKEPEMGTLRPSLEAIGCTSMESSTSLSFFSTVSKSPLIYRNPLFVSLQRHNGRSTRPVMELSSFPFQKFVQFALEETKRHTQLVPSPLQDDFSRLIALDGKTELKLNSYKAPRMRLFRSFSTQGNEAMQVLDFAVFPTPEYDLPIFCANFFATPSISIIVLDLNPLHDVISRRDYKEKYYKRLIPLGLKYAQLLPWGGKLTSESLKFFSPIVIWTKFCPSQSKYSDLYSAFVDYYKAWLDLMDEAEEETNPFQTKRNQEAQHRYLTWRAEKDPGHRVLKKLVGDASAKDLVNNFLFNGLEELGSETFLDYFPEYKCEDGSVNEKRSVVGKSFEDRPWDARGEFLGNGVT